MESETISSEKLRYALANLGSKSGTQRSYVIVDAPAVVQIWIDGYSDTFLHLFGEAATRVLTDKAFENVVKSWIQTLDQDIRSELETTSNSIEALRFFTEASQRTGLFKWSANIELKERSDGLCMRIRGCSGIERCEGVSKSLDGLRNLSCPLLGCSRALLSKLTGKAYLYKLENIESGKGICEGVIAIR